LEWETTMNLLWLEQASAQRPALVGGKTANLSRLADGYRVPAGFCLTTAAFDRAHRAGQAASLPRSLYAEIAEAYGRLAAQAGMAEPPVAVRSSAVDEDGDTSSFAGQHETYLNISGVEAIAAAVRRCWMSALTPQVLAYRRERGLATDRIRLAVLIQQLVAADVAAVLFSANPLTGARSEVVINASWGLGESIVGGTVTPDTYVARKPGGELVSRTLAEKRRMTVAIPGGTREVDVPRLLQCQPTLSDAQVAELAALASSLEQRMGWPVDVECAYSGGTLYLLQCRPITTLQRLDLPARAAA
jgi:phosphoenolpyruvate synthase/pyruvate phosphate dikinase